ncbi:MAG: hypothetical protein LBL92_07435, partial [Propionibacteriaceae bacterium]|nr:hypothetical protein [Propionibacteriaceae bacterium]
MRVLITAGGTSEPIDRVRSITNQSTGRLGRAIAETFAADSRVSEVIYVCAKTSVRPATPKARVVLVDTVASLETALKDELGRAPVEVIIHAMAVSDYRVRAVTSWSQLTESSSQSSQPSPEVEVGDCLEAVEVARGNRFPVGSHDPVSGDQTNTADDPVDPRRVPLGSRDPVEQLVDTGENLVGPSSKIRSDIDDLVLLMERTPKIIAQLRPLAPTAFLVGFKLLDSVPLAELIEAGNRILRQNDCDLVLANDLSAITPTGHAGYLINRAGEYEQFGSKDDIAAAIVRAAISSGLSRQNCRVIRGGRWGGQQGGGVVGSEPTGDDDNAAGCPPGATNA